MPPLCLPTGHCHFPNSEASSKLQLLPFFMIVSPLQISKTHAHTMSRRETRRLHLKQAVAASRIRKKKKHNVQIHCQTSLYSQRHRNGNPIWGFHYSYNKSKTTYFESMVGCPFFLFFSALANTTKHYFALSILHIEFSNYYLLFFTCFLSSSDFPCYYNTISISKIYFFL